LCWALASQDLIKNVIAVLVLMSDTPLQVGDTVEIAGHYGEVVSVNLRSTRVKTFEDNIITVQNSTAVGQAIVNSNSGSLDEMIAVHLVVPSHIPVMQVRQIAWESEICSPYVYLKKPVSVTVSEKFERECYTQYTVKCYVHDTRLERVLASDIVERFKSESVHLYEAPVGDSRTALEVTRVQIPLFDGENGSSPEHQRS